MYEQQIQIHSFPTVRMRASGRKDRSCDTGFLCPTGGPALPISQGRAQLQSSREGHPSQLRRHFSRPYVVEVGAADKENDRITTADSGTRRRVWETMVGRITSGKSLYGILEYNRLKVGQGEACVIFCNRMLPPGGDLTRLTSAHCRRVMQTWLDNKKNNRFVETIFHASLNPHPKDRLTEQQLADIAEEYMQQMGYGNQPYVVYLHRDIARAHLHIVSIRVGQDGQKIDDSNEKYRSKAILRTIEKEYGLYQATKQQEQEGTLPLKRVEYRHSDLKAQIASVVRNVKDRYRFCSFKEYNALLNIFQVSAEEVRGNVDGRPYAGMLYSALNENGDKVGVPIKSSAIGRDTGIGAIEKHYAKSVEWLKKNADKMEELREIVRDTMRRSRSLPEFAAVLSAEGVQIIVRQNPQGRIYGITFIDHDRGFIINGSKLGKNKEFTANRFHELFGARTADELEREVSGQNNERSVADSEFSESSATDSPTEIQKPHPMDTEAESRLIGQAVDTLDIFSTALEEGQYPEPYEEDFRPERKRRKKRRP